MLKNKAKPAKLSKPTKQHEAKKNKTNKAQSKKDKTKKAQSKKDKKPDTNNNHRLKYCIAANLSLFMVIIAAVCTMRDPADRYLRVGYSDELFIMSVKIDTLTKYLMLQVFLAFVEIIRVIVNEIASPILGFNIYNPDKKTITEFTKNELQIMANLMWLINSLSSALFIMVSISQIDIAMLRVVYSEVTSIFTIRMLLNEKRFTLDGDKADESDINDEFDKDIDNESDKNMDDFDKDIDDSKEISINLSELRETDRMISHTM